MSVVATSINKKTASRPSQSAVGPLGNAAQACQRPFLKWAGNKFRVLPHILPQLEQLTTQYAATRMVEPFAGAGAVFLNTALPEIWLNDQNSDLMAIYEQLQQQGATFIEEARTYFTPQNNTSSAYYHLRERFNQSTCPKARAVLLLYLNRHGYNGLCRYNTKGGYNVPFGRYKQPYFPQKELLAAARACKGVKLTHLDFEDVLNACQPGDVAYCDPPYSPLSATANFSQYHGIAFGPAEQARLANAAQKAAKRGVPVIISNHDTPETRELYKNAELVSFEVARFISCNGQRRNRAPELLAIYRPL